MADQKIECPNCGHEIELTEALIHESAQNAVVSHTID